MEKKTSSIPVDELEKLANMFKENNLEELVIETQDTFIRFSKSRKHITTAPQFMFPVQYQPQIVQQSTSTTSVSTSQTKQVKSSETKDPYADETKFHKVKSPINGTLYRSPSPGAEPFVKEGEHINAGQTLCIVEAMKAMNEIKSTVSGKLIKILKNNAEVVKSGDTLMIIEIV
ncbi:MAG: acetyl-CoA carboxylase biotin carboxyl carrier protein [Spirochaetia bacterium]|nr:acetyl-CoA carboxylase biotin carboxyl carrier protein [Spirochaetota bacterium]MCX8097133.1 acetyl-CoA carboxylase biotin carboxyl carrier protein [Spirochaetota bacterium]MDW8112098.1 acetyl-CoA carboxylase biotin carboxyl carrier protein [Spirochaetia bacterium]